MYFRSRVPHCRIPSVERAAHVAALLLIGVASRAVAQPSAHPVHHPGSRVSDSSFTAMQERGKGAMGVDQYVSTHHFTPLKNGGRIQLETVPSDTPGIARIRNHMREIAQAFSKGDFSTPGVVHARTVPGTADMARLKARITYTPRDLPRGGALGITTRDPAAVLAIHRFLAFQRTDHRAGSQ